MNLTAHLDEYCERITAAFWAEPANAITNFAIIAAGLLALRLYHRQFPLHGNRHRPNVLILIGLVVTIGIGSFLYHTFANVWSGYADVAPIMGFIYLYHAVFLRRILAMRYTYVLLYVLGFFGLSAFMTLYFGRTMLNGSAGYLPALMSLTTVWLAMWRLQRPGTRMLGVATLIFTVSLFARSMDMAVCGYWPLGTHFLWHSLNSVVLYLLLKLVIQLPNYYERKRRDQDYYLGR